MVRCYLSAVIKQVNRIAIPTERFAIASLDEGKSVIPVWLDVIYQGLASKLVGWGEFHVRHIQKTKSKTNFLCVRFLLL